MIIVFINDEYAAKVDSFDLARSLSLFPQARLSTSTSMTKVYIRLEHWSDVAELSSLLRLWNVSQYKKVA